MDLNEFRAMGKVLYVDPKGEFEIHAGDIYEARTTLGHTNLIVALREYNGWMYYAHGDKCRKVLARDFIRSVEDGSLELRWPDEIDKERLSMSVIMLDAIANRRTFEESMDIMADQADEYMEKVHNGGIIQ